MATRGDESKNREALEQIRNGIINNNAQAESLLREHRAHEQAMGQTLGTMQQAAHFMAESMDQQGQAPGGISPATANVLGRYGYGQPKVVKSSSQKAGPVPGRPVIVNNITNNNVTVPPVQHQPVRMRDGSGDGGAKLKAWMNTSFMKQAEQQAARERQYQRKENFLSKSTAKLMRNLASTSKSMIEAANPQKFVAALGDQFKVLMFFFWFTFLANNWTRILNTAAGIEKWTRGVVEYFVGKEGQRKSKFMKDVITVFGGDPEREDVGTAMRLLFLDNKHGLFGLFKLMFDNFIEERKLAMSYLKPPEPRGGLMENINSMVGYLGDVLMTIIGGKAGLARNVSHKVTEIEKQRSSGGHGGNAAWNTDIYKGIDAGDSSIFYSKSRNKYSGKGRMRGSDYDYAGNLKANYGASLNQARSLENFMNLSDGEVDVHEVMGGFDRLSSAINRSDNNMLPVTDTFFQSLKGLGLSQKDLESIPVAKRGRIKFVVADRSEADINAEKESLFGRTTMASTALGASIGGTSGTAITGVGGLLGSGAGAGIGMLSGIARTAISNMGVEGKHLIAVDENDPRPAKAIPIGNGKTQGFFNVKWLTPESIEAITRLVGKAVGKEDFRFSNEDYGSLDKLNAKMMELEKNKVGKGRKVTSTFKRGMYGSLKDLDNFSKAADAKIQRYLDNPDFRGRKAIQGASEVAARGLNFVKDTFNGISNALTGYQVNANVSYRDYSGEAVKKLSNAEQKGNVRYIMKYLIERGGMTVEQAAGVAGHLLAESSVNPGSRNPNDRGKESYGLAQWRDDRLARLRQFASSRGRPINDMDTQLDYLLYELQSNEAKAGSLLRGSQTVNDSAANFAQFERYQYFDQPGNNETSKRIAFAHEAYRLFTGSTADDFNQTTWSSDDIPLGGGSSASVYNGAAGRVSSVPKVQYYTDTQGRIRRATKDTPKGLVRSTYYKWSRSADGTYKRAARGNEIFDRTLQQHNEDFRLKAAGKESNLVKEERRIRELSKKKTYAEQLDEPGTGWKFGKLLLREVKSWGGGKEAQDSEKRDAEIIKARGIIAASNSRKARAVKIESGSNNYLKEIAKNTAGKTDYTKNLDNLAKISIEQKAAIEGMKKNSALQIASSDNINKTLASVDSKLSRIIEKVDSAPSAPPYIAAPPNPNVGGGVLKK